MRIATGGAERAKLVKRALFVGAALFLLCIMQSTVFGRWKLFGAVPDLMLCAVVLLGYCNGHCGGDDDRHARHGRRDG